MASDEGMDGVEEDPLEEIDELEESSPPSAEEIVSASLESGSLTDICDVSVTMRSIDTDEEELVKMFADHGCTCAFGPHKSPCCKQFSEDHYLAVRGALSEMTKDELDLMVMGQIMAHCSPSPSAPSPSTSPAEKIEVHTPMKFFHAGLRVCQQTFLFLHTIGIKRFKHIKASYLCNGPAARVHGNKGRKPKKTLSLQEVKDVVQYILNYTGIKLYSIH